MRWSDLDSLGHTNNAKLVTYLEEARIRFLHDHLQWDWSQDGLILARLEVDYKQPLFYPSGVLISTAIERIGTSSICTVHQILKKHDKALIAQAKVVVVVFDEEKAKPKAISAELREKLEVYLQ